MKAITYILMVIIILTSPSLASTIHSDFTCKNNGTTMLYSYLKEPALQESGYTRGLKTGSFHYLVGNETNLEDHLMYYDGLVDAKHPDESGVNHNASLTHDIVVVFTGEKGISEYYAKGFFPNKRAVSAFKKIWYVDFYDEAKSSKYRGIYDHLPSNSINVVGKVGMGPTIETSRETDYDFKYNATVQNGILEIWDSTGWTNKTGSKRIDWEQSGLMKGMIDVTNNLMVEGIYIPGGGGGEDWLPCCFDSLSPPIEPTEPLEGRWPTVNELAVLYPQKQLPNTTCLNGNCIPIECQPPGKCDNFECIYTSGELALSGIVSAASFTQLQTVPDTVRVGPSIDVHSEFTNGSLNTANYSITVVNTGRTLLQEVVLGTILPDGTGFVTSKPDPKVRPDSERKAFWNFGSLSPGEKRTVALVLNKIGSTNPVFENNAVWAEGISDGNRITSGIPKGSVKSAPGVEVYSGFSDSPDNATYSIVIRNSGKGLLVDVTLIDILPIDTTINIPRTDPKPDVLPDNRILQAKWKLGSLSPGEDKSVSLILDRLENASPKYDTNMVVVEARSGDISVISGLPKKSVKYVEHEES